MNIAMHTECQILCWKPGVEWDIETPSVVSESDLCGGDRRLLKVSAYFDKVRLQIDGVDIVVAAEDLFEALVKCDLSEGVRREIDRGVALSGGNRLIAFVENPIDEDQERHA